MNNSFTTQWRFSPLDTWFFRESRPSGSIGGTELNSVFPPPVRTIAGAIRTLIGDQAGVDWEQFNKGNGTAHHLSEIDLHKEIGDAEQLGQLKLVGPYLLYDKQRLYPVPLIVLEANVRRKKDTHKKTKNTGKGTQTTIKLKSKGNQADQQDEPVVLKSQKKPPEKQFVRLRPGEPVDCDLGYVSLPEVKPINKNTQIDNAKPIENAWLTAEDLQYVLAGETPHTIWYQSDLFDTESRLGIALDKETRSVEEHKLYQNQHIRVRYYLDLQIGVIVTGIDENLHPDRGRIRFGGEGRFAEVTVTASLPPPLKLPDFSNTNKVLLTLLTPANLEGDWLPAGFQEMPNKTGTTWRGVINGVELTILSAVLGKSIREGGWDLAKEQPRKVISLIPAGSVWFCQVESGNAADLQGYHIGKETELGRGELAVGIW